ncbi:MAG: response regulator [Chloroflexi bacterium]|nr:MAG: response regulator [Chloroflexota bacterium]
MASRKNKGGIKKRVMPFQLEKIRTWLPLTLVLIVIFMTVAITTGNVVNGFRREQKQALSQLELIAQLKEAEIDAWQRDLQDAVNRLFSQSVVLERMQSLLAPASELNFALLKQDFAEIVQTAPEINSITLVNRDGVVVGSTDSPPILPPNTLKVEMATYPQRPFYAPDLDQIVLIQSVLDETGTVLGAVVVLANTDPLTNIMKTNVTTDAWGQGYLVSQTGSPITRIPPYSEAQRRQVILQSEGIEAALTLLNMEGRVEAPTLYTDYRGVRVIGVAHWLPDLQVALIVEQTQQQVFASLYETLIANTSLALSATMLAVIIGLAITQSITNPMTQLADHAKRIAAGKQDNVRLNWQRNDEIGDLAQAFDWMAVQLVELIDSLEQRVADRTHQLEIVAGISDRLNAILDFDQLLMETAVQVKENFGYQFVHIYILDQARQNLVMIAGAEDNGNDTFPINHSLLLQDDGNPVSEAAKRGEIVFEHDQQNMPENTLIKIAVPITAESRVMGVLEVQEHRSAGLDEGDANQLRSLANHLAVALTNARLFAETRQRTTELARAKETAETANQAKSTFLANMSHELRTPLNVILGFTQIMERDASLPPGQKENLRIISRSGAHLLELINDVLEFSKIEAGQSSLHITRFDLNRTLTNMEKMMRVRAERRGLELTFDRAKNVPQYIKTDQRKLRQVLINLVGNAVKFTESGRVQLRVTAGEVEPDGDSASVMLHFEVEDTGPGISSTEIEKLFDAFTQTEIGQKRQEGTGLGLAICHKFAQLLEAKLGVSSEVGCGSIFTFDIRVFLAQRSDRQFDQRVVSLAANQPSYRILVVDDNAENRKLMRTMLEGVGFVVREAENGRIAVDLNQSWQPHLIWMDMRMPVMDGREATALIKQSQQGPFPKIIAVTATAFEEDKLNILSLGCDDFVGKPFREAEIFDKMARQLAVEYIYEDTTPSPDSSEEAVLLENLSDTNIKRLPSEWMTALQDAARRGQAKQINSLIEQIQADHAQVATHVAHLVKGYQFDQIVALMEKGHGAETAVKSIANGNETNT